ncbi:hypothetical protein GLOIN_2v1781456 [Rhizophagus irregularis DAOM 181602=DAOM 197198]|nr:hypothetical protein GLOIN_2v1781456 [Rhizophagus irregularis DAOM 181602=DAOM 197198]
MQLPSNRKAKNQDYLAIVRKYCFLFLKSQYVKAPIRYLLYKQPYTIPNANDYPQIDTTPSAPPSDYNPIPDVFIPTKYHDIILKDPIYKKTQQQRIEKLKADALIKEATYHGTTPKHYYSHTNTVTSLTNASDSFYSRMPNYLAKRKENHEYSFSNATLDKNLNKFLKNNK